MTEEELKVKFDHIQGIFNRCINHAYQIITDSIVAKSEYLNREQADELEQQEYIRTTDELAQLYIFYSLLFHLIIPDMNRKIQSMMKNCLIFP